MTASPVSRFLKTLSRFQGAPGRAAAIGVVMAVAGVFGAAAVGVHGAKSVPESGASSMAAPLTPVSVLRVSTASGYSVTRRFTGQAEAPRRADLGFEVGGRITEVLVDEGDRVERGAIVARLDTSTLLPERAALQAQLAALSADAELASLTLARNHVLTERGFRSVAARDDARLALARAQARIEAIRSQIDGVDVRLEKSKLVAPFDAWIGARLVDPGKTASAGEPLLVMFDAAPPRLRVALPPAMAATLKEDDTVTVTVGGKDHRMRILHIRPDLDPNTRSRAVIVALPYDTGLAIGDTAELALAQEVAERGFWAPLSALREGVRGSWSVMALERTPAGDRTIAAAVEAIHADGSRVFLRGGLPDGARIVAEAADRVAPGQLVRSVGK